jgi:uncharacterized membrane protein YccC
MSKRNEKDPLSKSAHIVKGLILNVLVSLPAILGIAMILASKGPLNRTLLSASFFLAGFTGVIVMIRKESPTSIGGIRGKWAVVEGLIFTIICWGIAAYLLVFGLE